MWPIEFLFSFLMTLPNVLKVLLCYLLSSSGFDMWFMLSALLYNIFVPFYHVLPCLGGSGS